MNNEDFKKDLNDIIKIFGESNENGPRIFQSEAQFQFELAIALDMKLNSNNNPEYKILLEVLSETEENKKAIRQYTDIIVVDNSTNEYYAIELWQPCDDIEKVIKRTYKKFGEKPSMVTEFGLCEPAFEGGDKRRAEILLERIPIYKSLPNMVGYVWFSLNDYRTHCGEYGEGKLKQRIHGSTDLYANEKPSYNIFKSV